MVQEAGTDVSALVAEEMLLGFGKCSLQVQVPEADTSLKAPQDLVGKKVATSFDVLAKQYFSELDAQVNEQRRAAGASEDLKTQIEYVGGSVEAACALGVADGIGKYGGFVTIIQILARMADVGLFSLSPAASRPSRIRRDNASLRTPRNQHTSHLPSSSHPPRHTTRPIESIPHQAHRLTNSRCHCSLAIRHLPIQHLRRQSRRGTQNHPRKESRYSQSSARSGLERGFGNGQEERDCDGHGSIGRGWRNGYLCASVGCE